MGELTFLRRPPPAIRGREALAERLAEVSTVLRTYEVLWRERPFARLEVAWEADHPELARWLRARSPAEVEELLADPSGLRQAPDPVGPLVDALSRLTTVGPLPMEGLAPLPDPIPRVSGRKRAQVAAFVATAEAALPLELSVIVEWCAGKGHVSRALSVSRSVLAMGLERDVERCRTARDLAASYPAQCVFVPTDVLDVDAWPQVPPLRFAVVGLHACGALTDAAIRFAQEGHAHSLLLAPCCFHFLGKERGFQPRSEVGRAAGIRWDAPSLRLPTLEEVVASPSVRTRRRTEMAWRLGLDLLLREAGQADYTPLGPAPTHWWKGSFVAFAERMAASHGLRLPSDVARGEALGVAREREVAAMGLPRSLFRRVLELWLVLDRASGLAEDEWHVSLGTFCDRELTPRNLAISARHPAFVSRP